MKLLNLWLCLWLITTGVASAAPSGLGSLPALKHPTVAGKPLPVEFLVDHQDPTTIHVVPRDGQFVSEGVVKSPIARCDVVRDTLKLDEYAAKMRLQLAQMYAEAQSEYARKQTDLRSLSEQVTVLTNQVPPLRQATQQLKARKLEIVADIGKVRGEVENFEAQLLIHAKDKTRVEAINGQIAESESRISLLARELLTTQNQTREKENVLTEAELTLADAKGRSDALDEELNRLAERIIKNKATVEGFAQGAEDVIKKYSRQVGAYATYVAEFAPASYLVQLEAANPGYKFRYVTSVTATVDATIPGNILPGSALEGEAGTLILASKWSDPKAARLRDYYRNLNALKDFPKDLLGGKDIKDLLVDPVLKVQEKLDDNHLAQFESSLAGTKFLALQLSTLGYCALKEPHSLASEFVGGAKDTFKLALYYTYPVHYAIRVAGHYNSVSTLHELWKMTKSSSWFGLSKHQKLEHVRRLTDDKTVGITVDAPGARLTVQESLALTEKVKEQLVYFSLERYLDKQAARPALAPFDDKALGATTVGAKLMTLSNPWAFWGGLVLSSLAEMFGSQTQESITDMTSSQGVKLDYQSGFTLLHSGDITVGDLSRNKEEVREIH